MKDPKYHAIDEDTETACTWIENFITIYEGRKGTKEGIKMMFRAFDRLMEDDFKRYPRSNKL